MNVALLDPEHIKQRGHVVDPGFHGVLLLRPVTLSAVIILGHMSLKIFDLIVALGRKDQRLDVPGIYMWTTTFDGTNYAQGAAIGILMLVSVAILVVPYLVTSMRAETEL